jgi:hypothetical protein
MQPATAWGAQRTLLAWGSRWQTTPTAVAVRFADHHNRNKRAWHQSPRFSYYVVW